MPNGATDRAAALANEVVVLVPAGMLGMSTPWSKSGWASCASATSRSNEIRPRVRAQTGPRKGFDKASRPAQPTGRFRAR